MANHTYHVTELTISKELADDIIYAVYKKDTHYAAEVEKYLKQWGFDAPEHDEDIKRQIYCLSDYQTERLLLNIN